MTIYFRLFFYHLLLTTTGWLQAQQLTTKTDSIKYTGLEKQIDSIVHVAINKELRIENFQLTVDEPNI